MNFTSSHLGFDELPMPGLKLIHISEGVPVERLYLSSGAKELELLLIKTGGLRQFSHIAVYRGGGEEHHINSIVVRGPQQGEQLYMFKFIGPWLIATSQTPWHTGKEKKGV